jgi:hypothetical protein
MPRLIAEPIDVILLESELRRYSQLGHLLVRKYGALLILESGPKNDRHAHARLRRVTRQWWSPELPSHDGHWSRVPERLPIPEAIKWLVDNIPWALVPLE